MSRQKYYQGCILMLLIIGIVLITRIIDFPEEVSSFRKLPERQGNQGMIKRDVQRLNGISVHEFKKAYAPTHLSLPLVFENSMDDVYAEKYWTREALRKSCGDRSLLHTLCDDDKKCHNVRMVNTSLLGKEWASLQTVNIQDLNLETLNDFMDAQDHPEKHPLYSKLYLHDAPMTQYCPEGMKHFQAPKYFPIDYRLIPDATIVEDNTSNESLSKNAYHPCLFIGKKGSGSPLHVDAGMTRFWMLQLSGRKRWIMFPPSEYSKLAPKNQGNEFNPYHFEVDGFKPDYEAFPQLKGALAYETILNPGDLLYVPEGWAHQVYNMDDIVATSMNIVDEHSNFLYLKTLQHDAKLSPQDGDTKDEYQQMKELVDSFFLPFDAIDRNIPWDEFFDRHDLKKAPVPTSVRQYLKETMVYQGMDINTIRDKYGRTPLHIAVSYGFTSVVDYIIKVGGKDTLKVKSTDGKTPLDTAKDSGFQEVVKLLESHGAVTSKRH